MCISFVVYYWHQIWKPRLWLCQPVWMKHLVLNWPDLCRSSMWLNVVDCNKLHWGGLQTDSNAHNAVQIHKVNFPPLWVNSAIQIWYDVTSIHCCRLNTHFLVYTAVQPSRGTDVVAFNISRQGLNYKQGRTEIQVGYSAWGNHTQNRENAAPLENFAVIFCQVFRVSMLL